MAEPEDGMDLLLRRSMTSWAQPRLSATFDRRLARRLAPRGLPRAGRWVLALYAAAALLASVWVMRSAAIDWTLIVPAVVAPLVVVAATWRRRLGRMLGISVIM